MKDKLCWRLLCINLFNSARILSFWTYTKAKTFMQSKIWISPYVRQQLLLRTTLRNSTAAFIISTHRPPPTRLFHGQVAVWTIFSPQLAWSFVVTTMINMVWMQIQHELWCCRHLFLLRCCIFPALFRSTEVGSTLFLSLQPILFPQRWRIWGRHARQAGKQAAWQIYGGRNACIGPCPPYRII